MPMASQKLAHLPVLPFPPTDVRQKLTKESLNTCFSIWHAVCQRMLELPSELFEEVLRNTQSRSLSSFLASYLTEYVQAGQYTEWKWSPQAQSLSRLVYLITHRAILEIDPPPEALLDWRLLGHLAKANKQAPSLAALLDRAYMSQRPEQSAALQVYKSDLIRSLDRDSLLRTDESNLSHCLLPLLRACPAYGEALVTGSDLLDAISAAYHKLASKDQIPVLLLTYSVLLAPLRAKKPNRSLVYDHLYSMRSSAGKMKASEASLLADLVTDTPFLQQLRQLSSGSSDGARGTTLAVSLEQYRKPQSSQRRRHHQGKSKSKQNGDATYGHGEAYSGVHVHRMSLVSQVQDLFPDLGDGFVAKLLDHYNDSVEEATAALLEDNLPPNLSNADRSEKLHARSTIHEIDAVPDLAPRSTPPTTPPMQRRNVHDDDAFDRLAISPAQLHRGRKDTDADALKQDSSTRSHAKAAIMSALAAFDADDDERDDTYDIEDVGGTVDTAAGPAGDRDATKNDMRDQNEEALFAAWRMDQAAFARDAATRRSKQRDALKSETGMTDEAIEGWGVMLQRDPSKLRRLEARFATFAGRQEQPQIERTSWRGNQDSGIESEDGGDASSGPESSRGGRGGGGYRGRGRGGRGGAGVAGPPGEKGTQVSRQRKEASKGSRANHNRRDGRARKMARGGFAG